MIPHKPVPGIHLSDYIACQKAANGEWVCDPENGEIYSMNTGDPVKFRKLRTGYFGKNVRYKGMHIEILKHRAVYVMANIRYGLPADLSLEVDHINHDKTDCRIKNLRLVTKHENEWAKAKSVKFEIIRAIRKRHDAGGITQKSLAKEYHISPTAVSRIVRRETYVDIEGAL